MTDEPAADRPAARRPRPYPSAGEQSPGAVAVAPRQPRHTAPLVSIGALLAALAFLAAALVVHLTAAGSSADRMAQLRDTVLLDARQDIVVLNTLDYRSVDQGLRRWGAASTGALHDSLAHVGPSARRQIVSARKITTAEVLDAAVVSLDPAAGSATVIASVQLRVASQHGKAAIKRERLRAEMARVGATWKVSSLEQVGVTLG